MLCGTQGKGGTYDAEGTLSSSIDNRVEEEEEPGEERLRVERSSYELAMDSLRGVASIS